MENMDASDLEGAINSAKETSKESTPKMTEEEEKGFHKGSLNTLTAERAELIKMIGNVEAIMKAHMGRLKELGVEFK